MLSPYLNDLRFRNKYQKRATFKASSYGSPSSWYAVVISQRSSSWWSPVYCTACQGNLDGEPIGSRGDSPRASLAATNSGQSPPVWTRVVVLLIRGVFMFFFLLGAGCLHFTVLSLCIETGFGDPFWCGIHKPLNFISEYIILIIKLVFVSLLIISPRFLLHLLPCLKSIFFSLQTLAFSSFFFWILFLFFLFCSM